MEALGIEFKQRQTRREVRADIVEQGQQDNPAADPEQTRAEDVGHPSRPVEAPRQIKGHLRQREREFFGFHPLALE